VHDMKVYEAVGAQTHSLLTSALVGATVYFRLRPLRSRGYRRQYSLTRTLGGSQSRSGHPEEEIRYTSWFYQPVA
jgi:hypothetical protein